MSKNLPKFITFTGVDEFTPVDGLLDLAGEYPVEFGILFSPSRQGSGRYPPLYSLARLWMKSLHLSAHICGDYSRELITNGDFPALELLIERNFDRVQVNTADPTVDPDRIWAWANRFGRRAILQTRNPDVFPSSTSVDWLFDASGGRGILPSAWPNPHPTSGAMVGYAGGLGPDNVAAAVEAIGRIPGPYWIDMETGVRDENDRFDLRKCWAVCEAVYGVRG